MGKEKKKGENLVYVLSECKFEDGNDGTFVVCVKKQQQV